MTLQAVPYFAFPGTAREAMEFYHSIFGGELRMITFGDFNVVPADDPAHGYVMHAALVTPQLTLAASDFDERFTESSYSVGSNLSVSLWGDDVDEGRRVFEQLAHEGEVEMEFGPQDWGANYGSCVDRFGQSWSVNVETAPAAGDAAATGEAPIAGDAPATPEQHIAEHSE